MMESPLVKDITDKLVAECFQHREFVHLSMDAIVRLAMRAKGQGNYRESKEARASYVVGDDEAKRRVLTVRGRTGACLVMAPTLSESSIDVMNLFVQHVGAHVRGQVEFVASDQPSPALHTALRTAFPNLQAVYLDEVHLPIVYNIAFWRKSSEGQKALRRVQAKFNRLDMATPLPHWGVLYTGSEDVTYSPGEERMRDLVFPGTMSCTRAASVLNTLDDETPWYSKMD